MELSDSKRRRQESYPEPANSSAVLTAVAAAANEHNDLLCLITCCSDLIFDWLNLDDLVALNTTCKKLQHVTAEYVHRKYLMKSVMVHHDEKKSRTGFLPRTRSMQRFAPNLRNAIVRFREELWTVAQQNKYIDSIFFWHSEITNAENELIARIVANVKTIALMNVTIEGGLFDGILKHCTQLKHLVIQHNLREYKTNNSVESMKGPIETEWPFQKYCPTIEHFCWLGFRLPSNLDVFFMQNPNIRSLQTGNFMFDETIDLFKRTNITVDDLYLGLVVVRDTDLTEAIDDLSLLYERKQFKNLMLKFNVGSNLDEPKWSQLPYVTGVCCSVAENKLTASIESTHLKLLILMNRSITRTQAVSLSQKLVNLESLVLRINSIEEIVPFIQNSAKLKEIYVHKMYGSSESIEISTLNKNRKKLSAACRLIVYLPDEAYVRMKWENHEINCSLIEFKRSDSYVPKSPFVINCIRYD